MSLSTHCPDELIAALPHLLGFKPTESLIFVPLRPDLPLSCVDLPTTTRAREEAWAAVGDAFYPHARPGATMAVICVNTDREYGDLLNQEFSDRLAAIGIAAPSVAGRRNDFVDFTTGEAGIQTEAARSKITVSTVLAGRARPATAAKPWLHC